MIAQSALHPPTSDSGLIVPCGIIYPSLSFKKLVDGPISSIYQQLNDDHNNSVVVCSHIFWKPICQNDDKRAPHHLVLYSPLFLIQYNTPPWYSQYNKTWVNSNVELHMRDTRSSNSSSSFSKERLLKRSFSKRTLVQKIIFQKNACSKDHFPKECLFKRSFSKRMLILVKSNVK